MNPLQQAAVRRKIFYFAAIVVLFTLSMVWRGVIPVPLSDLSRPGSNSLHRIANWLASHAILNQSFQLGLRELEQGEPELAGESLRLALTGSRGFAVAYLWHSAIEAQKRNDFHKLETRVQQVTRLQPRFITPWLFQGWNISYNVSVEMHGSGDMYFYIARGIELLAQGERYNTHTVRDPVLGERKIGSPDIRFWLAFTYQNKFGVSDQVEVLRCLFQLSCIPPEERNPQLFLNPSTGGVDLARFEAFCRKYPHLVRRLRGEDQRMAAADERSRQRVEEALKCPRPEDIIQFLRDNYDVPSRYKNAKDLNDPDKQFPVLPPRFSDEEAHPGLILGDDFSAFQAARAWYAYSCLPLPPQPVDEEGNPLPWRTPTPEEYNQLLYRVPRAPMLIIFRQYAPRAQSYQGEMEQKEGWFDNEGWRIDDPRDDPSLWWFPDADRRAVIVGTERDWSLEAWRKAADLWRDHGYKYGLEVSPERLDRYRRLAEKLPPGLNLFDIPQNWRNRPEFIARAALTYYEQNRSVTNFPYFLAQAQAEAQQETMRARKTLWQAEQARKLGRKDQAIRLYEQGLLAWRNVLLNNPRFHRSETSERTEEETYEYELSYLRLIVADDERVREKANQIVASARAIVPFLSLPFPQTYRQTQLNANETVERLRPLVPFFPPPYPHAAADDPPSSTPQWRSEAREEIKWYVAETFFSPFAGPIDPNDPAKTPWVRDSIKESVRVNFGIQRTRNRGDSPTDSTSGENPSPTNPGSGSNP
jgi:hypothetical protein